MKKVLSKILKFIGKIFKALYTILDAILITPISKLIYWLGDSLGGKNGRLDKFLNNPTTLIYISLIIALGVFFAVDKKVINLTETDCFATSLSFLYNLNLEFDTI